MSEARPCLICLFLRVLTIGALGALVGAFLGRESGGADTDLVYPAIAGAFAALLIGRRWLRA